MSVNEPKFGPCCACGRSGPTVRNVIMLPKRSPIPGRGWGCVQCHQPADGATAVVCDACLTVAGEPIERVLRWACRGYPASDGRVPIGELEGEFRHHRHFHPEMAPDDPG